MRKAKNASARPGLIIVAVVLAASVTACQRRPAKSLEQTGYVALVFEIEAEEDSPPDLAERMVELLKKRVDPDDECGLQWQIVATDQIEVRVPLPPAEIRELQRRDEAAREALGAANVDMKEVTAALALTEGRDAKLAQLAGDSAESKRLLRDAATAFDERERARAALAATTALTGEEAPPPAAAARADRKDLELALGDAQADLDVALEMVRAANFDVNRFERVLELSRDSPRRQASIDDWCVRFPALRAEIGDAVATYDAWRGRRKSLWDAAGVKRLVRGAGVLEFRLLAEPSPENPTKYDAYRAQLHERGPHPAPGDPVQWFPIDNPLAFLNLDSPAELRNLDSRTEARFIVKQRPEAWYVLAKRGTEHGLLQAPGKTPQWRVKLAYLTRDAAGRQAVGFTLDAVGGALFGELTGQNIGKQLCVFLDDVAYYAARIESRITTSGIITGDFSEEKLHYLVQTLQAGSLPARLKFPPISERVVEPEP